MYQPGDSAQERRDLPTRLIECPEIVGFARVRLDGYSCAANLTKNALLYRCSLVLIEFFLCQISIDRFFVLFCFLV